MNNLDQTKKILLYARKSTDEPERQILSIEAQLFELREFARKEGLTLVREYVESKTAKEPGREIFNEMIASTEKGEAEGILAWHPDRLARNSIDGGRIIYLVDTCLELFGGVWRSNLEVFGGRTSKHITHVVAEKLTSMPGGEKFFGFQRGRGGRRSAMGKSQLNFCG